MNPADFYFLSDSMDFVSDSDDLLGVPYWGPPLVLNTYSSGKKCQPQVLYRADPVFSSDEDYILGAQFWGPPPVLDPPSTWKKRQPKAKYRADLAFVFGHLPFLQKDSAFAADLQRRGSAFVFGHLPDLQKGSTFAAGLQRESVFVTVLQRESSSTFGHRPDLQRESVFATVLQRESASFFGHRPDLQRDFASQAVKGSQMLLLFAPGLVWLACHFATVCGFSVGTSAAYKDDRTTCMDTVCCENRLHPGAALKCCGDKAFNPNAATCCKDGHNYTLTEGLSEKVSNCCRQNAYNPLSELCCESTVVTKPAPKARCCGKEAFDEDNELCCGPDRNKTILTKRSSHHQCCGHDQYNTKTHCCSWVNNTSVIHSVNPSCCAEKSAVNGTKAYDALSELCCQSTIVAKPAANIKCCGEKAFDEDKELCCGPNRNKTILTKKSSHHQCCGHDQYNTKTHCCSWTNDIPEIDFINSTCCVDSETFDENKQLCCGPIHNKTILTRKSLHHRCCGREQYNTKTHCCSWTNDIPEIDFINSTCCVDSETFDENKQLCCGPIHNKTILTRKSLHHRCCGREQYNTKTHCCSWMNNTFGIHLINSNCSVQVSGVQPQNPRLQPICTKPQTSLCGSSCYNPNGFRCCERNQTRCSGGQCEAAPTVYNPSTQICCDGRVSEWTPSIELKGSPGQHCCGTEVYWPHTQICCAGRRHPKAENMHCCGLQAYNIKNQQMKCCAGTLYNLTRLGKLGHEVQCCGSVLQEPKDVCCRHYDEELLYSAKTGYRCCGHLYYSTSLLSCCAGQLNPIHQPGHHQNKGIKESRLQSMNNLNETDLCKDMLIGIVESVSPHSVVFSAVLKIHGRSAAVKALPSPYVLKTHDHCNSPKLIPGEIYFFDEVNFFIDFNHASSIQSLHFIMSKCYRR
ncbi:uncharacterized protein si:ch211-195m9.3 [Chelmon rostratus]|uniref:uncharacterized protein si:ch211-195m9.3 n=1 Tax=Chelmon rostratus TaxID=109905 RepID=UPI001BEBD644|nr:uncharacterized protein si:ch211-195m9.3 [Chelmon rostratus]